MELLACPEDCTLGALKIVLEYIEQYLLLRIGYSVFSPPRNVKIFANGNIIADFDAVGEEEQSVFIPGEYINDGVLELEFEFPEAISQKELIGYGDMRKMTLSMYTLSISSVDERP